MMSDPRKNTRFTLDPLVGLPAPLAAADEGAVSQLREPVYPEDPVVQAAKLAESKYYTWLRAEQAAGNLPGGGLVLDGPGLPERKERKGALQLVLKMLAIFCGIITCFALIELTTIVAWSPDTGICLAPNTTTTTQTTLTPPQAPTLFNSTQFDTDPGEYKPEPMAQVNFTRTRVGKTEEPQPPYDGDRLANTSDMIWFTKVNQTSERNMRFWDHVVLNGYVLHRAIHSSQWCQSSKAYLESDLWEAHKQWATHYLIVAAFFTVCILALQELYLRLQRWWYTHPVERPELPVLEVYPDPEDKTRLLGRTEVTVPTASSYWYPTFGFTRDIGKKRKAICPTPFFKWKQAHTKTIPVKVEVPPQVVTERAAPPTPSPLQSQPLLEMKIPNSSMNMCSQPKDMAIIHCSDKGATDLGAYAFGTLSAIKVTHNGSTTVKAVTAKHVTDALTNMVRGMSRKVYLRVADKDLELTNFLDIPMFAMSPQSDLDIVVLDIPHKVWSILGMRASKVQSRITTNAPVTVYTPLPSGKWMKSIGIAKGPGDKLLQFHHTASTDYGASGGLVKCGTNAVAIHICRAPSSGANSASMLAPMLPPLTLMTNESWTTESMFEPVERYGDWRERDDDDGNYFDLDYEELEDEYTIRIMTKTQHRELTSANRSAYSIAEREAAWEQTLGTGDWDEANDEAPTWNDSWKEVQSVDCKAEQTDQDKSPSVPRTGASTPSPTVQEIAQVQAKPNPPVPKQVSPKTLTTSPSKESSSGKQKPKTRNVATSKSSAPPGALIQPAAGKPKKKRRRKRKKKSRASTTGTQQTAPSKE